MPKPYRACADRAEAMFAVVSQLVSSSRCVGVRWRARCYEHLVVACTAIVVIVGATTMQACGSSTSGSGASGSGQSVAGASSPHWGGQTIPSPAVIERERRRQEARNREAAVIERFGTRAEGRQARAMSELVHAYVLALSAREYQRACTMVTMRVARVKIDTPEAHADSCAAVLMLIVKPDNNATLRDLVVTEVRLAGAEGYAFLSRRRMTHAEDTIPVKRENAHWRVAALVPVPLRVPAP
jgi:hypothetical protein